MTGNKCNDVAIAVTDNLVLSEVINGAISKDPIVPQTAGDSYSLFERSIPLSVAYPRADSSFPRLVDAIDDPSWSVSIPVKIQTNPKDPIPHSVLVTRRIATKRNQKKFVKLMPVLLFELSIIDEATHRELLFLEKMVSGPRAIKNHLTISQPSLTFRLRSCDSGMAHFSVILSYGATIDLNSEPFDHVDATANYFAFRFLDYTKQKMMPSDFYRVVSSHGSQSSAGGSETEDELAVPKYMSVPGLRSDLLRFQRRTVRWCLRQEGKDYDQESRQIVDFPTKKDLFGWVNVENSDLLANPFLGCVYTPAQHLKHTNQFQQMTRTNNVGAQALLAEEMGLGKTVEVLSLILFNKRPSAADNVPAVVFDYSVQRDVLAARTTLIITPKSILSQWQDEIKTHAPSLSVMVYEGKNNGDVTAEELASYDIVLTTYAVITNEVHYATYNPLRRTRGHVVEQRHVQDYLSPLMQIQFWRIVLDEVQMVRSSFSNASVVARLIPRVHSWGVTGTPVTKNMQDLQGLLRFLRIEPIASSIPTWQMLVHSPTSFAKLFSQLAIRHTRAMVEGDIVLPPQTRNLVSMPFNSIETDNYLRIYQNFLADCKLDESGKYTGSDSVDTAKMLTWLVKLRQTCCHARLGTSSNGRIGATQAVGNKELRTLTDVLDAMLDQSVSEVSSLQRRYYVSMLERGQILEKRRQPEKALELWTKATHEIEQIVDNFRELYERYESDRQERLRALQVAREQAQEEDDDEIEDDEVDSDLVKVSRLRLRSWLEVLHRCYFFVASAHFQLYHKPSADDNGQVKQEEDQVKVEMNEQDLEHQKMENDYYHKAQVLRREVLQESISRVAKSTKKLGQIKLVQLIQVDESQFQFISPHRNDLYKEIVCLFTSLNDQASVIEEWRSKLIHYLTMNIVDHSADPSGEEYAQSLDAQEYAFLYLEFYQMMLSDRSEATLGAADPLIKSKLDNELKNEENQEVSEEESRLSQVRMEKSPTKAPSYWRPLSTMMSFCRRVLGKFNDEWGLEFVEKLTDVQRQFQDEVKKLARELDHLRRAYNVRVNYYRQLQELSDNVQDLEVKSEELEAAWYAREAGEARLLPQINRETGRLRYLQSLGNGAVSEEPEDCIICQSEYKYGSWTACGHHFCRDCLEQWRRTHNSCPICKSPLTSDGVYNYTYLGDQEDSKEQVREIKGKTEEHANLIYSPISEEIEKHLKAGSGDKLSRSYGTKIDTIIRHLKWLRSEDPSAQVVVFSQWSEMLAMVEGALKDNGFRYATVGKDMHEFKTDSSYTCFLLHAKSQSAGLTLVNAKHVYLCEPLVNTALELQAISRVHRIGQESPTHVWLFSIPGTVEDGVIRVSTDKRLAYLDVKTDKITNHVLEESNSKLMEKATETVVEKKSKGGGEVVQPDDLWSIMFDQK
uniref:ARAD1D40018p n=1 Tax=Blastobotrys adeninivorans TaxID=409370 RepID=A0A060TIR2_BLAAD